MHSIKTQLKVWSGRHPSIERLLTPLWLLITLKWGRLHYWILRNWKRSSIFVEEWELGMCSLKPVGILSYVLDRFSPRSVLDVGCGTGGSLGYFIERGLDARGVEGSSLAIARSAARDRILQHDLENPLDLQRRFDLVWSFEVAEHIRPEKAETFVDSLVRHSDLIVMSAARPGQGGDGHFNEQPMEYWVSLMERRGLKLLPEETNHLRALPITHSENMMVFRRAPSAQAR
jgi:SAM-dependent methyltransferase